MPVLPPTAPTAPYDIVDTVLNAARVRMNDAIQQLSGDILTDSQPFTQQMTNSAWRRMQEFLANLGYVRLKQEVVLTAFPAVASIDPASQTLLTWMYFYDGVNYWIPPQAQVLPQDCIQPLRVWERPSGQNSPFLEMIMALDGLPDRLKMGRNFFWEWREDGMYLPGSTISMDLRVRYAAYLPDFVTTDPTQWYQQPVPMMRCLDAFAWYICSEASNPRGDVDGSTFDQKAEDAARKMFNRDVAAKQRVTATRRPYGRRTQSGIGVGGGFGSY